MLSFVYIAPESQQNKCSHTATWVRPLNPIAHPPACCGMLLGVVAKNLKTVKPPNIPFVPWSSRCSTTMLDPFAQLLQHFWGHARVLHVVSFEYAKSYGLYPSQNALQVQHCWELLHSFAHHCQHGPNNSQHCWAVGSCWGPLDVLVAY